MLWLLVIYTQCLSSKRKIEEMKNMKGRVFRKLKSISNRKPGHLFQANTSTHLFQPSNLGKEQKNHGLLTLISENLSVSEIFEDDKEEKLASYLNGDLEQKLRPFTRSEEDIAATLESKPKQKKQVKLSVKFDHSIKIGKLACHPSLVEMESTSKSIALPCYKTTVKEDQINLNKNEDNDKFSLLSPFEEKGPPGGQESVILYTTSLRGIRKTFDDCNTIRFLLESFRVLYYERDVSMHLEYREELWRILGCKVVPPRLFIRGKCIGGADEVVGLHEKGKLRNLLKGIPVSPSNCPCRGCAGMRFVLCSSCNGSQKVMLEGQSSQPATKCPDCNENGLVKCSICS